MAGGVERIEIDLSDVPLRPTGKKEIQKLETALIIGTLYRPEVVELIKDPFERATWADSLAIAAAALAREKAGYPVPRIADEIGRSETMIRNHLAGKTKAGKLVRETYEKLARGELKLVVPFTGINLSVEEYERLKRAERKAAELEEKVRELEKEVARLAEENKQLKKRLEEAVSPEELEKRMAEFEETLRELEEENRRLHDKLVELEAKAARAEELEEKAKRLEEELKAREEMLSKIKAILGC